MPKPIPLSAARSLPFWRRPITLLFVLSAAMPVAFATWSVLLNNFVIERVGFDGSDIGWLHTVREIPGFLSIGVIALLLFIREQVLGLIALALLGVATAITAQFPTMGGILTVTMLSSIGFHYFETVNQSLQMQWIDKARAPQTLGWIMAVQSAPAGHFRPVGSDSFGHERAMPHPFDQQPVEAWAAIDACAAAFDATGQAVWIGRYTK